MLNIIATVYLITYSKKQQRKLFLAINFSADRWNENQSA